jgi:Zn-dependent metalloprotease
MNQAARWISLVVVTVFAATPGVSQQLAFPEYRHPNPAGQSMKMRDSVIRLDGGLNAARRVLIDSANAGSFWLEFQPEALPGARTPQAAVTAFLARYAPSVFSVAPTDLELQSVKSDAGLFHYRYGQRRGGYRVLGAQVAIHVMSASKGFVVRSANGRLFPNVVAPSTPRLAKADARRAAVAGLRRADAQSAEPDLVMVPDGSTVRLAYRVAVTDSARAMIVTRFVDAQTGAAFAETNESDGHVDFGASASKGLRNRPLRERSGAAEKPSMDLYVNAHGIDWFGRGQDFVVWETAGVYKLADPVTGSQVRILNMNGAALLGTYCFEGTSPPAYPIVQRNSTEWPDTPAGREEVSAVHNLGETVTYYKNTFGRNGMRNNASDPLIACVHASNTNWNAAFQQATYPPYEVFAVKFRQETSPDGPSVAAMDVATHEFQHGVSFTEVTGGFYSDLETRGVNEAISDYFGARHRGYSCHGDSVHIQWNENHPGMACRELNNDTTLQQRYADPGNCKAVGGNYSAHCLGIAFSSTIWVSTLIFPTLGDQEADRAVYNGLRDYMTSTTSFWQARESVVKAAQDRTHQNQSLYPIVQTLETEFYERGIGMPPILPSLVETTCGQWALNVNMGYNPYLNFTVTFESGNGLNQDGSVANRSDTVYLGSYTQANLPLSFTAAQVNNHTGSDGHYHDVRVRVGTFSGTVGWLDYYSGRQPFCGPFTVTATAPGFVTVKQVYQLTGSATDPGSSWLWERSDGGAYYTWANTQNSSFMAYNGQYVIDWRLSAVRTYDSDPDTAWTSTQVCIPFVPACYALRADVAQTSAPVVDERTRGVETGDHFGSGLWMAIPQGTQRRLIRMYSFSGRHDSSSAAVPWPNILQRDGGDWTYPTSLGTLTVATRRIPLGEDRFLLRASGRLGGAANRTLAIGLAADPDLGEAGDDAMDFDADIGFVSVRDGASGRYIGYLPLAANGMARVQQFGAGLGEAPEQTTDALRILAAPSRVAADVATDVRFLVSGPEITVGSDGRFDVTFAVLHATSADALRDLARATRQNAAMLLANLPGLALEADEFGLRQSLSTTTLSAATAGSGGASSAVALLQAEGLTALNYRVPTDKTVTVRIRVYNSRGQLVRTLVDQPVSGGSYHVEWDRLNDRGQRVPPGVYVATMEAGSFKSTRKLVVTR